MLLVFLCFYVSCVFMISLIISTKNEVKNIANCLESIKQQKFDAQKIEIIVVDNNSTDQTKEIAQQYTDKIFNCGPERSAQRNFGAYQARGEILGFIDADMILSAGVISEVAQKFAQDKNLAGLYINERIIDFINAPKGAVKLECQSFFCKTRNFERQFYNITLIDAVRFMRHADFLAIGGFDENLFACEDWDLHKRLNIIAHESGRYFDILKSVIYHNEKEKKLKDLIVKKKYYVGSFKKYIDKWGREDVDIKKQFGFWYRYFGVFIENGKWRRLAQQPFLALGMFVAKIFVGAVYIKTQKTQKT